MLGNLVESLEKIEWNSKSINSHFTSENSLRKFSEGGNDLNLLLWGNYKKLLILGQLGLIFIV